MLQAFLDLLPQEIAIEAAVADFETALWQAMAEVMEDIPIQGCVFPWTQEHIPAMFTRLQREATNEQLRELTDYIQHLYSREMVYFYEELTHQQRCRRLASQTESECTSGSALHVFSDSTFV